MATANVAFVLKAPGKGICGAVRPLFAPLKKIFNKCIRNDETEGAISENGKRWLEMCSAKIAVEFCPC